jgi:hypothetical protein
LAFPEKLARFWLKKRRKSARPLANWERIAILQDAVKFLRRDLVDFFRFRRSVSQHELGAYPDATESAFYKHSSIANEGKICGNIFSAVSAETMS